MDSLNGAKVLTLLCKIKTKKEKKTLFSFISKSTCPLRSIASIDFWSCFEKFLLF